jgi:cytidine deaminase
MTDEGVRELLDAARDAAGRAFAPYSGYRVGAALRTRGGEIVAGCNVENASYGLSMCAERVAVFAAVARGRVSRGAGIEAICVHAPSRPAPWPCGACRQVLHEFATAGLLVLVDGPDGLVRATLDELLPHAFRMGER